MYVCLGRRIPWVCMYVAKILHKIAIFKAYPIHPQIQTNKSSMQTIKATSKRLKRSIGSSKQGPVYIYLFRPRMLTRESKPNNSSLDSCCRDPLGFCS